MFQPGRVGDFGDVPLLLLLADCRRQLNDLVGFIVAYAAVKVSIHHVLSRGS